MPISCLACRFSGLFAAPFYRASKRSRFGARQIFFGLLRFLILRSSDRLEMSRRGSAPQLAERLLFRKNDVGRKKSALPAPAKVDAPIGVSTSKDPIRMANFGFRRSNLNGWLRLGVSLAAGRDCVLLRINTVADSIYFRKGFRCGTKSARQRNVANWQAAVACVTLAFHIEIRLKRYTCVPLYKAIAAETLVWRVEA